MRTGPLYPQGAVNYDSWQLEYETTFSTTATTLTISGLTGDTAEVYKLTLMAVNNYAGTTLYYLRPNADTGSNYGSQALNGIDTTVAAVRATPTYINLGGAGTTQNDNHHSETLIYAKSGYLRTVINSYLADASTTTIAEAGLVGHSWTNTADQITSLVITASQADGLGIGTYIGLWKKVVKV